MAQIEAKEIPCPNSLQNDPPKCESSCDFCGGASVLIVKPKSTVCEVCQNMGNVVATANGYAGAPCPACKIEPTPEQIQQAIAAILAANASDDAPVRYVERSTFADAGSAKPSLAGLLAPTVKPSYWKQ